MDLIMTNDQKKRIDGRLRNIDDLVLCEIVRYGCYNDGQDDRCTLAVALPRTSAAFGANWARF
jgi:hypothetical protein